MAYLPNPFLERTSESTTSDHEFAQSFSPKVLERLPDDVFEGRVHIFRSPPGGGKTTLLRAFTPPALRAIWNMRGNPDMLETYQRLLAREVFSESEGPRLVGVFLSCAAGYADLPPGATPGQEGLFRALLDCRIVLRSLRGIASLLGLNTSDQLSDVRLEYDDGFKSNLSAIPDTDNAAALLRWAEEKERKVYAQLDSIGTDLFDVPSHVRFEGLLWLQEVRFIHRGVNVAPNRLLMIDDVQKLRKKQRALLIEEVAELRPRIPVWLAERDIALGDELLAQGARENRDIREYPLEELWGRSNSQFMTFAQNVLDRRLRRQSAIPISSFSSYLRDTFSSDELREKLTAGIEGFKKSTEKYRSNQRYEEWFAQAEKYFDARDVHALIELNSIRILIARDIAKKQMSLDLAPLQPQELEERDDSSIKGAAQIFAHEEAGVPYYYGIDRLCILATNNVEELLGIAAKLYDGMKAKQILGKPEPLLSPIEQEKAIKEVIKRKRDFIPKHHTEGTRAQRLLDAVGTFCRDKTFLDSAPYAPGVTGIRLSQTELQKLSSHKSGAEGAAIDTLKRVLSESAAENLFVSRPSAATGSRDSGTVFYLNRGLCVHYGLPVQLGGWQDVSVNQLIDWMENGLLPNKKRRLDGV